MCYPKPGPRCSAHAKKRLIALKAKRDEMNSSNSTWEEIYEADDAVAEAELEFDSTPVGQKILEMKIAQYADQKDDSYTEEYRERMENGKNYRKLQLNAISSPEKGDIKNHASTVYTPADINGHQLLPFDQVRTQPKDLAAKYRAASDAFADSATEEESTAFAWYTSSGFQDVNAYLRDGTVSNTPEIAEMTTRAIPALDSAFARIPDSAEKTVVYHGMGAAHEGKFAGLRTPEAVADEVRKMYPVGTTLGDNAYKSTSYDPATGSSFARNGSVVMEIKAKSLVPVGQYSSWNDFEREAILDRKAKLKVLGIGVSTYRMNVRGKDREKQIVVIQCEETD